MTQDERALVDRVELILGRSMAIALPADMANRAHAKWTDELGPALVALVRRLDSQNERHRHLLKTTTENASALRAENERMRAERRVKHD